MESPTESDPSPSSWEADAAMLRQVVVPHALEIIRRLRRLPAEALTREVSLARRTPEGFHQPTERRIQENVADMHHEVTRFRDAARAVGEYLAAHFDISTLNAGGGPVHDTPERTAGARFLGRLINAVIAGRTAIPRNARRSLGAVCDRFRAQLVSGTVEVEWIYPIPRLTVPERGVALGTGVLLRPITDDDLTRLQRLTKPALVAIVPPRFLLDTASALVIRRVIAGSEAAYIRADNRRVSYLVQLALTFVDHGRTVPTGSWAQAVGPSVFEIGGAAWPGGPYRDHYPRENLTPEEADQLKRIYSDLESCPQRVVESLPFHRLVSGWQRDDFTDALVDLWVALEALLLTDQETTELQYRMSLRAARLVRPPEPRPFISQFKNAYNDRSKLVHGAKARWAEDVRGRLNWAHDVLRTILLQSVRQQKLPDCIALEDAMILS